METGPPSKNVTSRVKNWIIDSISGFNVTQKVQTSIRQVLGLAADREPTRLEANLVDRIDHIVRRGKSPSFLIEDEVSWQAFETLVQFFPGEMVNVPVKDAKGSEIVQEMNLFKTLHQYALAARGEEQAIEDLQRVFTQGGNVLEKEQFNARVAEAKARNNNRTALFQRIIFNEADRIERGEISRVLWLSDRRVSLDELVQRARQPIPKAPPVPSDKIETAPPAEHVEVLTPPSPEVMDDLAEKDPLPRPLETPKTGRGTPEVVSWKEICDQDEEEGDESLDNSFKLDF